MVKLFYYSMKRPYEDNEIQIFKKNRISMKTIPSDCLSHIFTFVDIMDIFILRLVCHDWCYCFNSTSMCYNLKTHAFLQTISYPIQKEDIFSIKTLDDLMVVTKSMEKAIRLYKRHKLRDLAQIAAMKYQKYFKSTIKVVGFYTDTYVSLDNLRVHTINIELLIGGIQHNLNYMISEIVAPEFDFSDYDFNILFNEYPDCRNENENYRKSIFARKTLNLQVFQKKAADLMINSDIHIFLEFAMELLYVGSWKSKLPTFYLKCNKSNDCDHIDGKHPTTENMLTCDMLQFIDVILRYENRLYDFE